MWCDGCCKTVPSSLQVSQKLLVPFYPHPSIPWGESLGTKLVLSLFQWLIAQHVKVKGATLGTVIILICQQMFEDQQIQSDLSLPWGADHLLLHSDSGGKLCMSSAGHHRWIWYHSLQRADFQRETGRLWRGEQFRLVMLASTQCTVSGSKPFPVVNMSCSLWKSLLLIGSWVSLGPCSFCHCCQ